MPDRIACSQYGEQNHKCLSGFCTHPGTCWGAPAGCHGGGHGTDANRSDCMREDGTALHLMNEKGLPVSWPKQ